MTNPFVELRELNAEYDYNFGLFRYWQTNNDLEMSSQYFKRCVQIQGCIRPLLKKINTPISEKETFVQN